MVFLKICIFAYLYRIGYPYSYMCNISYLPRKRSRFQALFDVRLYPRRKINFALLGTRRFYDSQKRKRTNLLLHLARDDKKRAQFICCLSIDDSCIKRWRMYQNNKSINSLDLMHRVITPKPFALLFLGSYIISIFMDFQFRRSNLMFWVIVHPCPGYCR